MAGNKVIAVDLGGTNLRVSLVKNNKIIKYDKQKTPKNEKKLLEKLEERIMSLIDKDVKAIGVSSAGPLKDGIIKNPPNLPLKNFNLQKFLEKRFKKKVVISNDANCAALAEAKLGCRKKNFILLTLGTGLGGGIIINGEPFEGQGYGGELGHIILDNGKDFEDLWKQRKGEIKELFEKKDKKQLEKIARYLGQGIASLINIFDPEIVILTGGVRETGNKFLNMIKKETQRYVIIPRKINIQWSKLEHPGTLGASLLIK